MAPFASTLLRLTTAALLTANEFLKDKMEFLNKAHAAGVRNIEMEALAFASFCQHLGIRAAVICSAILVIYSRLTSSDVMIEPVRWRPDYKGP